MSIETKLKINILVDDLIGLFYVILKCQCLRNEEVQYLHNALFSSSAFVLLRKRRTNQTRLKSIEGLAQNKTGTLNCYLLSTFLLFFFKLHTSKCLDAWCRQSSLQYS